MANWDIFIFDAHGEGDSGAVGNGKEEYKESIRLNNLICEYLKPTGLKIHRNNGKNNYKNCQITGNTYNYKFGFTNHLNSSADSSATGTEILVQASEKYIEMEENILYRICRETGLSNRGLKSRNYDTEKFELRNPNSTASFSKDWYKELREARNQGICLSIIECCFLSNPNDVKIWDKHINTIAFIIADEIAKYCGKSISNGVQSSPTINSSPNTQNASKGLLRVKKDNASIGAFANSDNVLNAVKNALNSNDFKSITIERV